MRATSIPGHERSFFTTGIDNSGKRFFLKPVTIPYGSTGEEITFTDCLRDNGDESFYFKETTEKDQIVLHFTAGYLKGDIAALSTPTNHVSVSFVIARSGEIIRLWPSKFWSYHLGPGASGGNTVNSKRTVGIELSNIGYLRKSGSNLVTSYSATDVYCGLDETRFYQQLPAPFRGESYFATFTDSQYVSLISLLDYLEDKHMIPLNFLDEGSRYKTLSPEQLKNFNGVVSHINYRKSGKWDLGQAFDWNRLIGASLGT
jgi:N-acetyl-anhydromuramyl-L-alanine amidase AmpD